MLRVPGIGTMHGFWAKSHASANWAGVAFFFAANASEHFNDRHVRCHVFRREAIEPSSQVRLRVELRAASILPVR